MELKLTDVIDTLHRRCRYLIQYDNIDKIFVRFEDNNETVRVFIILNDNPDPDTLTSISLRYTHLFDDLSHFYTFEVLGSINYFKPNKDTYTIWNKNCGFMGVYR
jgi:hypothetical protein